MTRKAAKIWHRISLTPKMLFLAVLVGMVVWSSLDQLQSRTLREILKANLAQRLQKHVHEDRIRFDNYVAAYNQAAKLIVSQHSFHEYVADYLAREGHVKPSRVSYGSSRLAPRQSCVNSRISAMRC